MELHKLQLWMQDALIESPNAENATAIDDLIRPSFMLSAKESLAIYQRSYYSRLLSCMKEQFKALCHALEEDLFSDFAKNYLRTIPSTSPTLTDLGSGFADYLQASRPDSEDTNPEPWIDFMVDLARFEWELYRMFDAPGSEHIEQQKTIPPDDQLMLQNCFSVRDYNFPVNVYYREVASKKQAILPYRKRTYVALSRKQFKIGVTELFPIQYSLLKHLTDRLSIDVAVSKTAEIFKENEKKIRNSWNQWKTDWYEKGFFIHHNKC